MLDYFGGLSLKNVTCKELTHGTQTVTYPCSQCSYRLDYDVSLESSLVRPSTALHGTNWNFM